MSSFVRGLENKLNSPVETVVGMREVVAALLFCVLVREVMSAVQNCPLLILRSSDVELLQLLLQHN